MSYDIIKGIKIDEIANRVLLNYACSSLRPRLFSWSESPSLSAILKEQGKEAVEKIILRYYWEGNFQGGTNLYRKTVDFYQSRLPYTWENVGNEEDKGKEKYGNLIEYSNEELETALHESFVKFKNRDMSKVWVITSGTYFVDKVTKTRTMLTPSIVDARRFKSFEEAWIYCNGSNYNQVDYGSVPLEGL